MPILLGALLCKFHNQHFAVNILQVLLQHTTRTTALAGGLAFLTSQTLVAGWRASCSSADVHAMHPICCPCWPSLGFRVLLRAGAPVMVSLS